MFKMCVYISLGACLLISCLKDRTFNINSSDADKSITPGILVLNEISSSGSTYLSEFGNVPTDWIELYNTTSDTMIMEKDRWFITDDQSFPAKYTLPLIKIAPHRYFIICCDSQDSVATQVHTNFGLSSNGESVGLYFKTDGGPFSMIDSHIYGSQTSGISIGRVPDGSANWANCSQMTPGESNR